MIKQLRDIAAVDSGYTLRTGVKDSPHAATRVVQAKDVRGLRLTVTELPRLDVSKKAPRLLKFGDVLLSARGTFRATVFTGPLLTIASSSLFVISVTKADVLPEFLAIYLNSSAAQGYFSKNATGASIKGLLIDDLRNLKVPIPLLEQQKSIVDLYLNIEKQNELLAERINLNSRIANDSINAALEGVAK